MADRIVATALERFGRVDTLVNNAGVFVAKPFTEYTAEDYQQVVAVNLDGFFHLTQRVIAPMLEQGGGHIVGITTVEDVAMSVIYLEQAPLVTGETLHVDGGQSAGR